MHGIPSAKLKRHIVNEITERMMYLPSVFSSPRPKADSGEKSESAQTYLKKIHRSSVMKHRRVLHGQFSPAHEVILVQFGSKPVCNKQLCSARVVKFELTPYAAQNFRSQTR